MDKQHPGKKQAKKRNTKFDMMLAFWKDIYKPMSMYEIPLKTIENEITIEEWNQTVADLNFVSAAGPSGISYRIIRKLPEDFLIMILRFINISYRNHLVPSSWKTSNIAPIPKP